METFIFLLLPRFMAGSLYALQRLKKQLIAYSRWALKTTSRVHPAINKLTQPVFNSLK